MGKAKKVDANAKKAESRSPVWPRVADGALINTGTRLGDKMPDYLPRRLNPNPPNTITSRTMTTMIQSMRGNYPEVVVPIAPSARCYGSSSEPVCRRVYREPGGGRADEQRRGVPPAWSRQEVTA
jgi:hypothetical protein